ncbi:sporulation protein [Peribacillus huizhouensis]|uniref:Sporulation-control protein n=1 Tax=Peribacillus huizhouensis TaxID=1501239 RepID=A0ABR6CNP1_9BACI|nr:sporulation protein [Peribacillus huizhouensis]MBA9026190.1 sporulation-control protein [Peribacillus huizhouensis]
MILRKSMSLLGIGSAQIDLILPKEKYHYGESIHGNFCIKGGTIKQQIKRIECDLVRFDHVIGAETVIDTIMILSSRDIHPEEVNEIPFYFQLPAIPSPQGMAYQFKTRLTFDKGMASKDSDRIQII